MALSARSAIDWVSRFAAARDRWLPILALLSCVCLFVSMADAGPAASAVPATQATGAAPPSAAAAATPPTSPLR